MSTLVHIHAPKGHYIGQVRLYGHRKWQTVTGRCTCKVQPVGMPTKYKAAHDIKGDA